MSGCNYDSFCLECGRFIPANTDSVGGFDARFCDNHCFKEYSSDKIGRVHFEKCTGERSCSVCGRKIPADHEYILGLSSSVICSAKCYRYVRNTTDAYKNFQGGFVQESLKGFASNNGPFAGLVGSVLAAGISSIGKKKEHVDNRPQWMKDLNAKLNMTMEKRRQKMQENSEKLAEKGKQFSSDLHDETQDKINNTVGKGLNNLFSKMGIVPDQQDGSESTTPSSKDMLKGTFGGMGDIFKNGLGKKK